MTFLERKNKLLTSTKELLKIIDDSKFEGYSNTVKGKLEKFDNEIQNELVFKVLCLGEFNAGKSTFLNNFFLEENILPIGAVPTTAKITTIKYGIKKKLTIFDEKNHIHDYEDNISEILKNTVAVNGVDLSNSKEVILSLPSNVLKNGVVVVDTAGLNDSDKERSLITINYVEHADAVIFLLRANQAWSESEKKFLEERIFVKKDLNKIFFVINYWDILENDEERKEVIDYITQQINNSLSKLEVSEGISKELELFTISAKTGENFDLLKQKLFQYLEETKSQEILNQKIITLNTRLSESIDFLENQKNQMNNEKLDLKNEQKEIFNELKEFKIQKEQFDNRVTKKIDTAYENFLEDLEQESVNLKENIIEELNKKINRKKDINSINEIIKISLIKSERKTKDNFKKISNKFKKELNEISFNEKTTLNLRTTNLMDDEFLFNNEANQIFLNERNTIPEDITILAGLGALGGAGYMSFGLLTAATTTQTPGAAAAAWAWLAGGTTIASSISVAALATGGLALLAIATVPIYISLRDKSIEKQQEQIENIVDEIEEIFEENTNNFIRTLEEQKEKTIELILENMNNDILQAYEDKIKEYENMQNIKDNPEKIAEIENIIKKLNLLKV